jgi:hypothetical protein
LTQGGAAAVAVLMALRNKQPMKRRGLPVDFDLCDFMTVCAGALLLGHTLI